MWSCSSSSRCALFADGYEEVIRKLVNGLRFARVWSSKLDRADDQRVIQARKRLGAEPMKLLVERVAVPAGEARHPRGVDPPVAGDGPGRGDDRRARTPDPRENLQCYGKPEAAVPATLPADPDRRARRSRHRAVIAVLTWAPSTRANGTSPSR